MGHSLTKVYQTYQEIAIERAHICTGCAERKFLSHSHLIPRSYNHAYEAVKENIVYHCMEMGNDCHRKWEGMLAPTLLDFVANMVYIFKTDQTYYWKKFYKLHDFWVCPARAMEYNEDKVNRRIYDDVLEKFNLLEEQTRKMVA